jgi:hypothetical protein
MPSSVKGVEVFSEVSAAGAQRGEAVVDVDVSRRAHNQWIFDGRVY